jgi:hypothetical protein
VKNVSVGDIKIVTKYCPFWDQKTSLNLEVMQS